MKKLLILLVTIIFVACNKENVNPNRVSDEKNIYGKWCYSFNPSVWSIDISSTKITYIQGTIKEIMSIDDTAIWIKNYGTYPGYVHWLDRLSNNNDTLEFKQTNATLIKFKL